MAKGHTLVRKAELWYKGEEIWQRRPANLPYKAEPPESTVDLELDIFRTTGRAAKPLTGTMVRELDRVDIAALGEEKGSTPNPLKRITDRHHALARNLASGMKEAEAAHICGLSLSRVSILKNDAAFKELLNFYREGVDVAYAGLHEKLSGLASTALDELQDRMEDEPEKVSIGQLIELAKMGADRTGHGPQSSSTNLNVNVDLANRLEAARKRVRERGKIIDG